MGNQFLFNKRFLTRAGSKEPPIGIGANKVGLYEGAGAPTSGTSGTGVNFAGPGSLYVDRTNSLLYVNVGTAASPSWAPAGGGTRKIAAKTANYTVVAADCGTLFTNTGATGAVTFTLPAETNTGLWFEFMVTAGQNVTVTAAAGKLVAFNNAAATSITYSTAGELIGSGVRVACDGTKWIAMPILGSETATPTIA